MLILVGKSVTQKLSSAWRVKNVEEENKVEGGGGWVEENLDVRACGEDEGGDEGVVNDF